MTKTDPSPSSFDTNILVYANLAESPFHEVCLRAIERFYELGVESRQVLREYAAVLTRPQHFSKPQPIEDVVSRVRFFESGIEVADETAAVTHRLLKLLQEFPTGGR